MELDAQRITGRHVGPVKHPSTMGRDARSYVYRAAQMLGLDQFLAIKPLNGIDFVPNLRTSSNEPIGGRYDRFTKILTINTVWSATTHGAKFLAGELETVAEAARTPAEAMQRTFVHELAHHVHRQGGDVVNGIIESAFFNEDCRPITRYAKILPSEYFAESLTAYAYHRTALQTHDPIGYNMVVDVLTAVGVVP